jgi:hypothetical protein
MVGSVVVVIIMMSLLVGMIVWSCWETQPGFVSISIFGRCHSGGGLCPLEHVIKTGLGLVNSMVEMPAPSPFKAMVDAASNCQ